MLVPLHHKLKRRLLLFVVFSIFLIPTNLTAQQAEEENSEAPGMWLLEALDELIQPTLPMPEFSVEDQPNDAGGELLLRVRWLHGGKPLGIEEFGGFISGVDRVKLYRYDTSNADRPNKDNFSDAGSIPLVPETTQRDSIDGLAAYYFLRVIGNGTTRDSEIVGPVRPVASWFNWDRLNLLIASIIVSGLIILFIRIASSGRALFIRRINGLDAIEEAIGRATEMGRKVMFIPGIMDVDDPQTIAGLTILGRVARRTAEYRTELDVPTARSMAMVAGREIVRESYLATGHPEDFSDEMVHYITDDQFGFAAAVDGIMLREKPATIFYQGTFYAESLILAETGHSVGAIQIAGTAMVTQLPFFITACDYTLIGEELFAASAYLSREPKMLGSLKGQDYGKLAAIFAMVVSVLVATVGSVTGNEHWADWLSALFKVID